MSIPVCRDCEAEPEQVDLFVQQAQEHNADPVNTMAVSPRTMCYGGNHYDPSTNSFICPPCKRKRLDLGQEDMYDQPNENQDI